LRDGPTPSSTYAFECELEKTLREAGRQVVEHTYNAAESEKDEQTLPPQLRLGRRRFRRNRKTPNTIATRFGAIVLWRVYYQSVEPGEPGMAPLERRLGVVARSATPALADEAAQLNADQTQAQTCQVLERRFGVRWSQGTLRRVVAAMAQHYAPLRHHAQVDKVIEWLRRAAKSRGKHRPTLSAGRDGVHIPTRPFWEEASTATLSVIDRNGKRLGTVYLGRMPQEGQTTLTAQLLTLLRDVLMRWTGQMPRLIYVTDAGTHPQEFFRTKLKHMKHPRTGAPLAWEWIVDYYHACERITKIAEALFGKGDEYARETEATRWAAQMRRVLRDQRGGVTRVVQAAQALRRHRGLQRTHKEFDKAVNYLKKYTAHMDYAGARRRGLPIGSGVTEAACKMIFGYRFKQSGMRWKYDQGQHVLDLRVILKSGIWDTCRTRWLAAADAQIPATPKVAPLPCRGFRGNQSLSA
jgi:hypothetical protein